MPTAFITGASSGIGAAFARALASRGLHLILTGRRREQLEALKSELQQTYGVQVETIIADLTQDEDIAQLENRIKGCSDLVLLINNAGYGIRDLFIRAPISKQLDMMKVHNSVVVRFTHAALPQMLKNNQGSIINVASLLGMMAQKYTVIYSATKAFLIRFSVALNSELKKKNIQVQALCPGLTRSDFFMREELKETSIYQQMPSWLWHSPAEVAKSSIAALATNKCVVVPGFINRFWHVCLDIKNAASHLRFYRKKRVWY